MISAEIVTEMERMRAADETVSWHRVSQGRATGGFTLNSRGSSTSPLPLTQKQREDMDSSAAESTPREQKQDGAASDRSRSREAARSGKDPRSLDLEYQALLQQYAQDALREEFLMSELGEYGEGESVLTETTIQNPPARATEQRSSKANGESRRRARGNYGGARKSPALGAADYLGKPGEPRRVRADITRFVERRRQIDPIGADIRSRERQVKLMKQQQQRQARKAYMEKLKQPRSPSRRALVKQRSEDADRRKVKELRQRVKNAKPTVNIKSCEEGLLDRIAEDASKEKNSK